MISAISFLFLIIFITLVGVLFLLFQTLVVWNIKVNIFSTIGGTPWLIEDKGKKIKMGGGVIGYRLRKAKKELKDIPNSAFLTGKRGKQTLLLKSPSPGVFMPYFWNPEKDDLTLSPDYEMVRNTISVIEDRQKKYQDAKTVLSQLIPIISPLIIGLAIGMIYYLTADTLHSAIDLMRSLMEQNADIMGRLDTIQYGSPPR
tara:strand:- start:73 stop:675 length:603 start_codon:yes stop_codon:yes gene_type:complete